MTLDYDSLSPKPTTTYSVVRARFLLPLSDQLGRDARIEDGYILTQEDKIIECGQYTDDIGMRILSDYTPNLTIVGSKGSNDIPQLDGCLLPGFVKAHGHSHESPLVGLAKDVPLTEWLDNAVNLFTGFLNEQRDELTAFFKKSPNLITYLKDRLDDIHYGITSACIHHCNHNKYRVEEIVQANVMAGTKMVVAVGCQDRNYDDRILDIPATLATDRLNKYKELYGTAPRTSVIPGPDQIFSNTDEILKISKDWAREHNTRLHCHSSEEPNTTKWFTESHGMTPVQYAEKAGILDENTIFAHQVNNTEEDLRILSKYKVKIVHNPLANSILGSGLPDVVTMIDKYNIPVAISTDGSGSADNQNMLGAAKLATQYQRGVHANPRVLPAQQCLEMITRVPAEFYGWNTGQIATGFDADWVLVDLTRPNLCPTHVVNVTENLIWAADGSEIQYVMANGVLVKDDYKVTVIDSDELCSEIKVLTDMLLDYMKTAKQIKCTGAHGNN
ncbi:hypothetical protein P9112_006064 [Eukaryota sp. TZLM1-RC]